MGACPRTLAQACHADLAQVRRGRHGNTEGAFGNQIPPIGDSDSKRTLRGRAGAPLALAARLSWACGRGHTCCRGVYLTVCVLSWLLISSTSFTASALLGPLKLQSSFAFPAPLVLTVK